MRFVTLCSLLAVSCVTLVSGFARADATLDVSKLTRGEAVEAPKASAKPKRIGANERVSGFYVRHAQQMQSTVLTPSKKSFDNMFGGRGGADDDELQDEGCFSRESDERWHDGGEAQIFLRSDSESGETEVQAYRRMQVERTGDKVTLRETAAWVDPVTRGVRLIGTTEIPLQRLHAEHGLTVLVGATADAVKFILEEEQPRNTRHGAIIERPGGSMEHTNCAIAATVRLPERGQVEVATMLALGDLGPVQEHPRPGSESDSFAIHRTRAVQVQGSASFLGRDAAPVVTWSMGWVGAEMQMPVHRVLRKHRS